MLGAESVAFCAAGQVRGGVLLYWNGSEGQWAGLSSRRRGLEGSWGHWPFQGPARIRVPTLNREGSHERHGGLPDWVGGVLHLYMRGNCGAQREAQQDAHVHSSCRAAVFASLVQARCDTVTCIRAGLFRRSISNTIPLPRFDPLRTPHPPCFAAGAPADAIAPAARSTRMMHPTRALEGASRLLHDDAQAG